MTRTYDLTDADRDREALDEIARILSQFDWDDVDTAAAIAETVTRAGHVITDDSDES